MSDLNLERLRYIIIDEMSMVGRKQFGSVDQRLRQAFPHYANEVLGGASCILIGDFGQLPPVMDLPLYTTASRSSLSDLGRAAYQCFQKAVVLDQVIRQRGNSPDQVHFRNILHRLRNAEVTTDDGKYLMTRTAACATNRDEFFSALHLMPTVEAVAEHNLKRLQVGGHPIALIKAVHTGPNADKASTDDASGLEPVISIAKSARVMLTANLWVEAGLVNGTMGTVQAICYQTDRPPALPVAVMVKFDVYSGPTLPGGAVPICPFRHSWFSAASPCSRLQLPLKLAWAITIHKAQGLTLKKAVIDIGKKEFSTGLSFVACSRAQCLSDLIFNPPFTFQHMARLAGSQRLQERQLEDARLRLLEISTIPGFQPSVPESILTCTPSLQYSSLPPYYSPTLLPSSDYSPPGTPSPLMDYSTPSPPSDYSPPGSLSPLMDYSTPSPPSDYSHPGTPPPLKDYSTHSPPSDYSHPGTPSPLMDYSNPSPPSDYSPPGSPSLLMDYSTPSPPSDYSPSGIPSPLMDYSTPSPPSDYSPPGTPPPLMDDFTPSPPSDYSHPGTPSPLMDYSTPSPPSDYSPLGAPSPLMDYSTPSPPSDYSPPGTPPPLMD